MIEHSTEIRELARGLAMVQHEVGGVERDSANPHYGSTYASLGAVINAVRIPLGESGIAFTQSPGQEANGKIPITTMLIHHPTGQWMRSTIDVPLTKKDAQGLGAAITYGCRYALMAILGVAPLDDDAEGAVVRTNGKQSDAADDPF